MRITSVSYIVDRNFIFKYLQSHCEENVLNEPNNETLSSFYTAAVIEFNSPGDRFKSPHEVVEANLAEYMRWIDEASEKGVDILVFSEAALNYNGKILITTHSFN